MEKVITEIEGKMTHLLDNKEMEELHNVLICTLKNLTMISKQSDMDNLEEELNYCNMFIYAKKVEGCSPKSIKYYKSTIENMLKILQKSVKHITTDNLRKYLGDYNKDGNCSKVTIKYLGDYNKDGNCSKVTIDNIRRIISSFFSWLEEENYILKSPVRRIHKIKTEKIVKETYTDENIEIM